MMEFAFGIWQPGNFGFKSVNVGKTKIEGIDIGMGIERKLKKLKINTVFGYTLSDFTSVDPGYIYAVDAMGVKLNYKNTSSDTLGEDLKLKYRPRHLVKADIQLSWLRYGVGMTYRYNSRIENVDAIFVYIVNGLDSARISNASGDHVFDLRFHYEVTEKWKLRFTVNNVLNEEYMSRPADMRPPRSYSLQLSYKL
jgi:iron complex outermembrane receptor protein